MLLLFAFIASFGFASVAGATQTNTLTPGLGLLTPAPKRVKMPKSTEFPFFQGLSERHEGHTVAKKAKAINGAQHSVRIYCEDCGVYFGGETVESHTYNAQSVCSACGYACPHSSTHTETYPQDGALIFWNGSEYYYDAWQIEAFDFCDIELLPAYIGAGIANFKKKTSKAIFLS